MPLKALCLKVSIWDGCLLFWWSCGGLVVVFDILYPQLNPKYGRFAVINIIKLDLLINYKDNYDAIFL